MSLYFIVILVLCSLFICLESLLTGLTVSTPRLNEIITVKEGGSPSAVVDVNYNISHDFLSNREVQACLSLIDILTSKEIVSFTCVDVTTSHVRLTDIPLGDYLFSIVLIETNRNNEIIPETRIQRCVMIMTTLNHLSDPHPINIMSKEFDNVSRKMIVYSTSSVVPSIPVIYTAPEELGFPSLRLSICVKVFSYFGDENLRLSMQLSCLSSTEALTFTNLSIGQYLVYFVLKQIDSSTQEQLLLGTVRSIDVVVMDVKTAPPPSLSFPPCHFDDYNIICISNQLLGEGVVDPATQQASVAIGYEINAHESLKKYLNVCVDLFYSNHAMIPSTCLPSEQNILTLSRLAEGVYVVNMVIQYRHDQSTVEQSRAQVTLDIRRPVEFIPSYSWQPLHAWHTIPQGIETRLPVGQSSQGKEARIPDPWRLQLSLPSPPCKFFLRKTVHRDSLIHDIL